jgi:hypothetical protein
LPSNFSISIAISGHTIAQNLQPVQPSISLITAKW